MQKLYSYLASSLSLPTDSLVLLRLLYVCQLTRLGHMDISCRRIRSDNLVVCSSIALVLPSVLAAPGHLQGPSVMRRAQREKFNVCLCLAAPPKPLLPDAGAPLRR